jgi:ornithine cyclodeaminase/alanine dehydrogenase-like protein (mu-crystallin family)
LNKEDDMTLLLSRTDLAPLFSEPESIQASLQVIRQALRASTQEPNAHQSWLAYPLGTSPLAKVHVNLLAAPEGTSVRLFPPPAGPTVATGDSLVVLFDEEGRAAAIMDQHDLGSWRTSGVAAVACAALAPAEARSLAVLGSGLEAGIFMRAVRVAMPGLRDVRVHSRTPANRERLAQAMSSAGWPVRAVAQPREAVEGADVVFAAVAGGQPQFEAGWVRPGAVVASITWGSVPQDLPARRVLPDRFQPEARPTGWEPWPARRGELWGGEPLLLADILRGAPARRRADETLLYVQFGVSAWDAPLLRWAYETARQRGRGTELAFAG